MKKTALIFSLLVGTFSPFPALSYWQNPWLHSIFPQGFVLEATTQNFFSAANYTTSGGEFEALPDNARYFASRNRFTGGYTLATGIQLRSSVDLSMASISSDLRAESSTVFSALELGLLYPFYATPKTQISWDLSGLINVDPVEAGRTEPLGHDGVHSLSTSLKLQRRWGHVAAYTLHGMHFPSEGLASLWFWNVGASLHFPYLALSGQVEGYNTVLEDSYTDEPSRRVNLLGPVNGGSYAFYTINPERLDLRVLANVTLSDSWSLSLSVLKTLNGRNSAEGFELVAGLRWVPGAAAKSNQQRRPVREQDFQIDRPQRRGEPRFGEDGEPLKDAESLMEDRFKKRRP